MRLIVRYMLNRPGNFFTVIRVCLQIQFWFAFYYQLPICIAMNESRMELTDGQWSMIREQLPDRTGKRGRPAKNNRLMINAILWILRTGAPWRDLPKCYGSWKSVYTRFSRWSKQGIWDKIFAHFTTSCDNESNMIDSSAVKAHQHAAGAKGGSNFNPWAVLAVG